eukprot:3366-Amphidinium_carterae.1
MSDMTGIPDTTSNKRGLSPQDTNDRTANTIETKIIATTKIIGKDAVTDAAIYVTEVLNLQPPKDAVI